MVHVYVISNVVNTGRNGRSPGLGKARAYSGESLPRLLARGWTMSGKFDSSPEDCPDTGEGTPGKQYRGTRPGEHFPGHTEANGGACALWAICNGCDKV
jgi:hypothetical protein